MATLVATNFILLPVRSNLITPVSSSLGCDESHQTPIWIKLAALLLWPQPWRRCRPRRTLVPPYVQGVCQRSVVTDTQVPIRKWLTWRAIRFLLQTGDNDPTVHSVVKWFSPVRLLTPLAVVIAHAKQRAILKGSRCFNM